MWPTFLTCVQTRIFRPFSRSPAARYIRVQVVFFQLIFFFLACLLLLSSFFFFFLGFLFLFLGLLFSIFSFQLGKALKKQVPLSVVGLVNYQGTEELFAPLLAAASAARDQYEARLRKEGLVPEAPSQVMSQSHVHTKLMLCRLLPGPTFAVGQLNIDVLSIQSSWPFISVCVCVCVCVCVRVCVTVLSSTLTVSDECHSYIRFTFMHPPTIIRLQTWYHF